MKPLMRPSISALVAAIRIEQFPPTIVSSWKMRNSTKKLCSIFIRRHVLEASLSHLFEANVDTY